MQILVLKRKGGWFLVSKYLNKSKWNENNLLHFTYFREDIWCQKLVLSQSSLVFSLYCCSANFVSDSNCLNHALLTSEKLIPKNSVRVKVFGESNFKLRFEKKCSPKPFGQTKNGRVSGRLACTSSKTEILNKIGI